LGREGIGIVGGQSPLGQLILMGKASSRAYNKLKSANNTRLSDESRLKALSEALNLIDEVEARSRSIVISEIVEIKRLRKKDIDMISRLKNHKKRLLRAKRKAKKGEKELYASQIIETDRKISEVRRGLLSNVKEDLKKIKRDATRSIRGERAIVSEAR